MNAEQKKQFTQYESAIELSLGVTNGCTVISQSNNYSYESIYIAAIILQLEIIPLACDKFTNNFVKQLAL